MANHRHQHLVRPHAEAAPHLDTCALHPRAERRGVNVIVNEPDALAGNALSDQKALHLLADRDHHIESANQRSPERPPRHGCHGTTSTSMLDESVSPYLTVVSPTVSELSRSRPLF